MSRCKNACLLILRRTVCVTVVVVAAGNTVSVGMAQHVLKVAPGKVELPLAVELPEELSLDATAGWQLVEEQSGVAVPAQVGAVSAPDGSVAAGRQSVLAIVPPGGRGDALRRFRLVRTEEPAPAVFTFTDVTDASVRLSEGEKPVFVYNHGVIVREDLPEQDERRSRACYIHPLHGLSGEVLTDDFPDDHIHHHGLWWAWPHVVVDGRKHDLWHEATMRQRFRRWLVREAGPAAAVLAVENGWFVGDEQVMVERVWMRAYRNNGAERTLDIELSFTPLKPITLRGADVLGYGGLTFRFAPHRREEASITVPPGSQGGDLNSVPLAWADFTSRFHGMDHRSGAAIFTPPDHYDYPPPWFTRYYGRLCVGWPGLKARDFEADVPFALHYRLWIHRKAVESEKLGEVYQGYLHTLEAGWE